MSTDALLIDKDAFRVEDGIHVSASPVVHREEEYASEGFDSLRQMQEEHFWYRGRHQGKRTLKPCFRRTYDELVAKMAQLTSSAEPVRS